MANDWILILGMLTIILLIDILIAAVIKVCRALGYCVDPSTHDSPPPYHSVDGNSMRSKCDDSMNIDLVP
jgi:hypothetical protein